MTKCPSVLKTALVSVAELTRRAIDAGMPREKALATGMRVLRDQRVPEPVVQHALPIALFWAESGFPMVEPGHRLAASFMATSFSGLDMPRTPWPCFAVMAPPGLLSDYGFVLVQPHDGGSCTTANFWGASFSIKSEIFSGFLVGDARTVISKQAAFSEAAADQVKKISIVLDRLVVGCWLEMQEYRPADLRAPLEHAQHQRRTNKTPTVYSFKLTRPVKVDVREAVRDYVEGKTSSSPSVQTLVRGHWKQQPHGPGRELRKYIHVEPYWRGPEDAPIAVRPHRIDG